MVLFNLRNNLLHISNVYLNTQTNENFSNILTLSIADSIHDDSLSRRQHSMVASVQQRICQCYSARSPTADAEFRVLPQEVRL